ncbi:hypothetical protein [Pseudoalteromonas sp. Z9A6]|uniref:hypothetical protein n=1 Tax=Pseudoalteromonas sp. Z9A6 TaxID=2686352 RepID=UPI001F107153|nr:hypothetical protein [Pseudoalteromonas sp. Z9A6]
MKYLKVIALTLLLSGCTNSMTTLPPESGKVTTIDYKSYELNETSSSYVGDPILTRKAYKAYVEKKRVTPSNNFQLTGGLATVAVALHANIGDQFQIVGINENGNRMIAVPGSHLSFGIDKSGLWDHTMASASYWSSPVGGGSPYTMSPDSTKFTVIESVTPLTESGYINHELIFTGKGSNGLHFIYREYTFENMAKQAFKQELIYPADSKEIRFKNYKIIIESSSSTELVYKIASH